MSNHQGQSMRPEKSVPITDDRVVSKRLAEEMVHNFVNFRSFRSLPNDPGKWTRTESREELDAYRGMTIYYEKLPEYCAKFGRSLDDIYEEGMKSGRDMAKIIESHPYAEKMLKSFLKRETKGKGEYGAHVPGLLNREFELPTKEKQLLVFYRGMRKELQNLRQQNIKNDRMDTPDPKIKEPLETIVQTLVRLNTISYTRHEYPSESLDRCRVSVAFDNLPRLCARSSDTLNDFFARGKDLAVEMAEVMAAHPGSEKFVYGYLKNETTGLGVHGQEVQNSLLADEHEMLPQEKEKLMFYRGMLTELQFWG